jgi:hypothetical protein
MLIDARTHVAVVRSNQSEREGHPPTYNSTIELHAPTSSTQKLKLIGKVGQFTYTPTLPLTCRLPQAAYVEYWSGL